MLRAIEGLPEDEREVFELVRIQGLTHAEAAEVLGVSVKTVQRRLNRARLLLAERWPTFVRPRPAGPRGRPATPQRPEETCRCPATPRVRTARGDARLGSDPGRSVPRLPGAASRGPAAVEGFPPR